MNLSDRKIPLKERVKYFHEDVPHGTRLDVIGLVADLWCEVQGVKKPAECVIDAVQQIPELNKVKQLIMEKLNNPALTSVAFYCRGGGTDNCVIVGPPDFIALAGLKIMRLVS